MYLNTLEVEFETYVDIAFFLNSREKAISFATKIVEETVAFNKLNIDSYSVAILSDNRKIINFDYEFLCYVFLKYVTEEFELSDEIIQKIKNLFFDKDILKDDFNYFFNILLEIYIIRVTIKKDKLLTKSIYKIPRNGNLFTMNAIALSTNGLELLVSKELINDYFIPSILDSSDVKLKAYYAAADKVLKSFRLASVKVFSLSDFLDLD